ncbi:hypothetical protein G8770_05885 [Aestuariicella hydrocarbonica]|uniref:Uncharacterized protein n=1 Tax=Pseudomaricurvus hydrocarbonicus TaxID=1470433 RepID=A0A9E5JV08_9GAMM|nr:DUF6524 family protein [Aestuariicella hydrocarbonica]NHO65070.1 hypothetical protein [Aestuariicella hydrocarbonica]
MARSFSIGSFIVRWLFASALVFATYNPSGYSYVSVLLEKGTEFGPVLGLAGIVLIIAWVIYLRATFLALGWLGVILGTAFSACFVWLLIDLGWLSLDSPGAMEYVVLLVLSFILAVGMSWSHIRRRISGQVGVDELEH